jgi:hypothetical protein
VNTQPKQPAQPAADPTHIYLPIDRVVNYRERKHPRWTTTQSRFGGTETLVYLVEHVGRVARRRKSGGG